MNNENIQGQLYVAGTRGYSAYEIAVQNGFVGTENEWLESLKGEQGEQGVEGKSSYQVAVDNGYEGTEEEWLSEFLTPEGYILKQDIVDNLESNSNQKVLSAKQGKELKQLVDNKYDKSFIDESLEELNENINSKANSNDVINTYATKEDVEEDINSLSSQISGLASGSPLVASSTAGMTDTTKVYVNTSDGNWYYYDGDSWEIGGVYQAAEDSDSVELLLDKNNKLSDIIYSNCNQFKIKKDSANNVNRFFYPFKIKVNHPYKLKLKINEYTPSTNNSNVSFTIATTSDANQNTLVDWIKIVNAPVDQDEYEFLFTPTSNANYFYLYIISVSETALDLVYEIYEPFVYKNRMDNIENSINSLFEEKESYSVVEESVTSNTKTDYYHDFEFEKGKIYNISVSIQNYSKRSDRDTQAGALVFRTKNENTVTDTIKTIYTGDFIDDNYTFIFKATGYANIFDIWVNCGITENLQFDVVIRELIIQNQIYPEFTIYGIGDSLMEQGYFMDALKYNYNINYTKYSEGSTGFSTNNNVSAKTTFYDRVSRMSDTKPDLILIEGGTNDFGKNKTLVETENGVRLTIQNLYAKYGAVPIVVMLPTQRNYSGTAPAIRGMTNDLGIRLIEYVNTIKTVCDEFSIKTINLYTESGLNVVTAPDLTVDGLHWTPNFAEKIADIIYPTLKDSFTKI